jgi:hypothetical protein
MLSWAETASSANKKRQRTVGVALAAAVALAGFVMIGASAYAGRPASAGP